jgi:hypothetical protein
MSSAVTGQPAPGFSVNNTTDCSCFNGFATEVQLAIVLDDWYYISL